MTWGLDNCFCSYRLLQIGPPKGHQYNAFILIPFSRTKKNVALSLIQETDNKQRGEHGQKKKNLSIIHCLTGKSEAYTCHYYGVATSYNSKISNVINTSSFHPCLFKIQNCKFYLQCVKTSKKIDWSGIQSTKPNRAARAE